jgi:hypothetical protein
MGAGPLGGARARGDSRAIAIASWRSRKSGVVRRVKTIAGMAQRFVACDREQSFLMPPDARAWLLANHLAWSVIDAVGEMELEAFYGAYRFDGAVARRMTRR